MENTVDMQYYLTNVVKQFHKLYTYYDDIGCAANIPVDEYNDSAVLKDEVFELLKKKPFFLNKNEYNWVIEYCSIYDGKGYVDGICVRVAETY